MQHLFKLSLVLLLATVALAQAPTEKQDQYNRFKTKIINGGFENGTSNWSASGGTLTANTTLSNVRSGLRSGSWDATAASQTLTSSANTVSAGNAQVSCWFMTTATDYEFAAYDGTNKLVTQTIPASSVFQRITLNYALSDAGQLRARITSASNAAVLYIDDCFAGEADNVGSGNVATDWAPYTPTYNGFGTVSTSNILWRRVGDAIEISGSFVAGTVTASEARVGLPSGITSADTSKIPNLQAAGIWSSDTTSATTYKVSLIEPSVTYLTFGLNAGSTADLGKQNANSIVTTGTKLSIHASVPVKGWGSQSVWDANINPAYWSGYHGADCQWSSTSSSYADVSAGDASCTFTEVINNNFGTVTSYQISSNNAPGIVFSPTRAGVYEVCAESSGFGPMTTGQRQGKRLYDGTNVIGQTEYQTVGITQDVFSHKICGFVNASDLSSKTYKLQVLTASGTITLGAPSGSSLAAVYWTIKQLSAVATAPLIQGNVVSNSLTAEKINRAKIIISGGTPTINTQSGSWLSSISDFGAGDYRMNFVSGIWSSVPSCVVTAHDDVPNGDDYYCVTRECTGTSTCRVECWNRSSGALVDHSWDVICMGPK